MHINVIFFSLKCSKEYDGIVRKFIQSYLVWDLYDLSDWDSLLVCMLSIFELQVALDTQVCMTEGYDEKRSTLYC